MHRPDFLISKNENQENQSYSQQYSPEKNKAKYSETASPFAGTFFVFVIFADNAPIKKRTNTFDCLSKFKYRIKSLYRFIIKK